MRIRRCPIAHGFDTSVYVPKDALARLHAAAMRFRIGYVRRDQHVNFEPDRSWPVSVSKQELEEHLEVGFAVGFVQFARFHGRKYLSAKTGYDLGYAAGWNVRKLGCPEGTHVFVDAEWTDNPAPELVLEFLREWARGARDTKCRAGVYVGFEGLTGEQWYSLPGFNTYWRSGMRMRTYQRSGRPYADRLANVTEPLPRGWALWQGLPIDVKGIGEIDPCQCHYDNLGERPYFVTA